MNKFRNLFSNEYSAISPNDYGADFDEDDIEAQEAGFFEQIDETITLSRTERIYGFVICFLIGWIITGSAMHNFSSHPRRFVFLYSLGNTISLCATMFLYGPWKQIKSMFDEVRRNATLVSCAATYTHHALRSMCADLMHPCLSSLCRCTYFQSSDVFGLLAQESILHL